MVLCGDPQYPPWKQGVFGGLGCPGTRPRRPLAPLSARGWRHLLEQGCLPCFTTKRWELTKMEVRQQPLWERDFHRFPGWKGAVAVQITHNTGFLAITIRKGKQPRNMYYQELNKLWAIPEIGLCTTDRSAWVFARLACLAISRLKLMFDDSWEYLGAPKSSSKNTSRLPMRRCSLKDR